jgi:ribosomal protein L25 (general stress protein Ctc)
MKKSKKTNQSCSAARRARSFRVGVLVAVLLVIGVVTAIAKYESRRNDPNRENSVASQPGKNYVSVEVGGKKLQVNAQALQQGPLTQEQAQQIADALKDNKSTDGLVQVQNSNGSVSIDLQGRFQNVVLAKKNDDGSVSQACVDNSEAAAAFLQSKNSTNQSEPEPGRRVAVKEQ